MYFGGVVMLENYPDILNLNDMCVILKICRNSAVKLLKSGKIKYGKIGRVYKISKKSLIEFINE